jgi:hypothetical protein
MGIVHFTLTDDYQPSEESLKRLAALKDRPIDYSDIPESTLEEMEKMHLLAIEKRKKQKQMFSLRLPVSTINWWKSFGNGYTGIMAKLLDEARKHPEWIKNCL